MTLPARALSERVEETFARLDEKPTLARHVAAARDLAHLADEDGSLFEDVELLVARNFTLEPIEPFLAVAGFRESMRIRTRFSSYDPLTEPDLGSTSPAPDAVLIALGLRELAPALTTDFIDLDAASVADLGGAAVNHVVALANLVRSKSPSPIFVMNFVEPRWPAGGLTDFHSPSGQVNTVRAMNIRLAEALQETNSALIIDVAHLFGRMGLDLAEDERGNRLSDAPLSVQALRELSTHLVRNLKATKGQRVKCVVLDCDGTLWGGVIGEDGPGGIILSETGPGRRYFEFQRELLALKKSGTVLAISSKNELDDVLEVFNDHPDCPLSASDFAAMRIDWNDKAQNIQEIAEELNLGLGHLLFVDDNPAELHSIRTRLPEVRTLTAPTSVNDAEALSELGLFDSFVVSDEDRSRTEMYRADALRRSVRSEVGSVDDYLRSLQMVVRVGDVRDEELPRVAQLVQKTNQFNLTTRRHDNGALTRMMNDSDVHMVLARLDDRFGSSGTIGCGIVVAGGDTATIDTLLLSCRVIGRKIESALINQLANRAKAAGAKTLIGEFIPSERNAQVTGLYERIGFTSLGKENETVRWAWNLEDGVPLASDLFVVEEGIDE